MAALGLLGLGLIIFAVLYLIFHFLRSLFSTKYYLSWRIFYPSLIGGIILFVGAMVIDDTNAAQKLEETTAENTNLTNEIAELKEEVESLTQKVTDTEEYTEELEKAQAAAIAEKDSLGSKVATLEEEVSRLTEENKTVTAERDSLTEEVASLNSTIAANASSSSSASFDETESVASSEPSTSTTYEFYDNCSAAQAAGAAPVYAGDPGYGPHLDRDGDGVGCEY
ncbi:excalibur calcium-binding domain-containing protein [Domibacillus robiginosus]|uniref:excalibur calcium-binding domain-containing protein n=1 Tax=Domibacillus robiginosus TaxID=1071054 RepID=UPI000A60168B|nr:excalibur calcium-binding domain-containing protein [Domibacillus robiginosus]